MEPERLHLPDEVLELPVRAAHVPRLGERGLHRAQVLEELLRRGVGEVRIAGPGGLDPGGQEEQHLTVRLARRALLDLGRERLGQVAVALAQREERAARRRRRGIERQLAAQPRGVLREPEQDVLGRDDRGLGRHLGGDVGVAVPVPADPGAEADERRGDRRRGAGHVGLQRDVEGAVDERELLEQGPVEHAHRGADLVQRGRPVLAHRRGPPQHVDLGQQTEPELAVLGLVGARVVPLAQHAGEPGDRAGDGAPAGLGRVGREHRAELEGGEAAASLLDPDLGPELGDGTGQGVDGGEDALGVGEVAGAQHADPVVLLRHVDQVEVGREGAGDLGGTLGREGLDELLGPGERLLVALVGLDGESPEGLDVLEQALAARLREDHTQQLAEQSDVGAASSGMAGAALRRVSSVMSHLPGGPRAQGRLSGPRSADVSYPFPGPGTFQHTDIRSGLRTPSWRLSGVSRWWLPG